MVHNLYEFLDMEKERHRNEDSEAPRITSMLCIPIFHWPAQTKPAGDTTVFDAR